MALGPPEQNCARCNRPAPEPIRGPDGQTAQGWITFVGEDRLIIDIPCKERSILPVEVANAIGAFAGLVILDPDPQIQVSTLREVDSTYLGVACPECVADTGWDTSQWLLFLSGLDTSARAKGDEEGGE